MVEDYTIYPTRQLLAMYERLRAYDSYLMGETWESDDYLECESAPERIMRMRAMKEELAKREHIPNVPESRAIRQQKAFEKKHRGRQN